jgi:hypothetical protein
MFLYCFFIVFKSFLYTNREIDSTISRGIEMKKQFVIVGIMLVMLITVSLSGCVDEKSKFIGTWTTSGGGGSITFSDDNKVVITGQIGDFSLSGTHTWAVAGEKITFTSEEGGSAGWTFNYRFPTDTQLILTSSGGGSVTLTKA